MIYRTVRSPKSRFLRKTVKVFQKVASTLPATVSFDQAELSLPAHGSTCESACARGVSLQSVRTIGPPQLRWLPQARGVAGHVDGGWLKTVIL